MAQAVAYIIEFLLTYTSIEAGTAVIIATVFVYGAATYLINRGLNALTPRRKNGETRGQDVTIVDTTAPIVIPYGQVRLGGVHNIPPLVYSADGKGRYLHQILLLGYTPNGCGGLDSVYIDQTEITAANITAITGSANDGKVTAGDFADILWARFRDGTQSTVDYILNSYSSTAFSSNFVGADLANLMLQFDFGDGKKWQGTTRAMSAVFRASKVYDPRLDSSPGADPTNSSYIAYRRNPALTTANFLMSPVGGAFPADEIDWDDVVTAADICDELVADKDGGTQPRYTCNGVIYCVPEQFEDNVKKLVDSMLGFITYRDGKWRMRAGAWTSVPAGNAIVRSDWLSIEQVVLVAGRESRYNEVKSFYIRKDLLWQRGECVPRVNLTYRTADGNERNALEVEQPLCIDESEAQRKSEMLLRQSRNGVRIAGRLPPRFQKLATFETITVTDEVLGWSDKTFRIIAFDQNPDGSVNVILSEEQSTDWADMVAGDYGQPSTATLPPTNPTAPSEPASLTVTPLFGGLDFSWPESVVKPAGTIYRLRECNVNSYANSWPVWDGLATKATIARYDSLTNFYWIEAGNSVGSYSTLDVNSGTPGRPYGAAPNGVGSFVNSAAVSQLNWTPDGFSRNDNILTNSSFYVPSTCDLHFTISGVLNVWQSGGGATETIISVKNNSLSWSSNWGLAADLVLSANSGFVTTLPFIEEYTEHFINPGTYAVGAWANRASSAASTWVTSFAMYLQSVPTP